jgi:hypothetical protein
LKRNGNHAERRIWGAVMNKIVYEITRDNYITFREPISKLSIDKLLKLNIFDKIEANEYKEYVKETK